MERAGFRAHYGQHHSREFRGRDLNQGAPIAAHLTQSNPPSTKYTYPSTGVVDGDESCGQNNMVKVRGDAALKMAEGSSPRTQIQQGLCHSVVAMPCSIVQRRLARVVLLRGAGRGSERGVNSDVILTEEAPRCTSHTNATQAHRAIRPMHHSQDRTPIQVAMSLTQPSRACMIGCRGCFVVRAKGSRGERKLNNSARAPSCAKKKETTRSPRQVEDTPCRQLQRPS
jgi:hypothetical protein